MKVLFLDIDGVVNKRENFDPANNPGPFPIDAYCAFLVGRIQLQTDCEVVLSSSWRHSPEGVENVSKRVIRLYDSTPTTIGKYIGESRDGKMAYYEYDMRGDEVAAWLRAHPEVTRYAILDDESDFHDDQPLFKTTFEEGLTDEIAQKVIEHLNEETKL